MPLREDDVAPRSGTRDRRTLVQVAGFALAIAATFAVFLTDNPQLLRLAVVGVAWAFVLATVAAGRRSTDRVAAQAREKELRRAYEFELEREAAARREYELELETELRRQAEEAMRAELDALRDDLAGVAELRDELARVAELRTDLTALSSLRDEVARVASLRDDVAALTSLRQELGQLAELRADMGRLRAELTEQLSSEMLVERIVMRSQATRLSAELNDAPGRALDAASGWADDVPPRELTGGWPAVRLDEPRETRQFDQVRVERAPARPPVPPAPRPLDAPATATWESAPTPPWETPATAAWEIPDAGSTTASPAPPTAAFGAPAPPPVVPPASPSRFAGEERWSPSLEDRWSPSSEDTPLWSATASGAADSPVRPGPAEPAPPTAAFFMVPPSGGPRAGAAPPTPEPLPSPMEWLAERSLVHPEPTPSRPGVPPRRRRGDDAPMDPAAATTQRPAVPPHPPIRVDDRGGYRVAVREERPAEPPAPPGQEKRLADILAENGASPATGGRRRRRYRDEDEPDDVLARVLGTD